MIPYRAGLLYLQGCFERHNLVLERGNVPAIILQPLSPDPDTTDENHTISHGRMYANGGEGFKIMLAGVNTYLTLHTDSAD